MNQKEKSTLDCWQNFLVCIALHMLLPLLPLLLELWFAKTIAAKSAAAQAYPAAHRATGFSAVRDTDHPAESGTSN